jgi:hypothetical protein
MVYAAIESASRGERVRINDILSRAQSEAATT